MTYCLGIKVREGLVCLSDGRITSGTQVTNAHKISLHGPSGAQLCIMTSGLRSLRDKTLAYFDRAFREERPLGHKTMLEAVEDYCRYLRQVAEEDRAALQDSRLDFNLHSIVSGQMSEDPEPGLFLIYPEGNWIEVGERTPYLSIGATAYGKPILDRALSYDTSMRTALKLAYLSFDSTRTSSADVGFPLDLMTYAMADRCWRQTQYEQDELREQRIWWNENITKLATEMPDGPWTDSVLPDSPAAHLSIVRDS
ncbi:MAG: peptidase [Kiloniellales bacterium]|nr:peptidase [Kiloniellales bacterium]